MAGEKSASLRAKDVKPNANAGKSPPSRAREVVINLVSDSEEDSAPAPLTKPMKRRASKHSGSLDANPRPKKRADTGSTAAKSPDPSSIGRLDAAQKQTRIANAKVAELEAKLKTVNAELHTTKNTLSHRDAEVHSYQQQEADLVRTKQVLAKKDAELDRVIHMKQEPENAARIEQLVAENQTLAAESRKMANFYAEKEAFDKAREAHTDLKIERDEAVALAESRKKHGDALKKSLDSANKSLARARSDINELQENIHDVECVRDDLEITNEEIMDKLAKAEAENQTGKAREKRAKEEITELLDEIANVKIQNILLSEQKDASDIKHEQEVSDLKEEISRKRKDITKLIGHIKRCPICSQTYEQRLGFYKDCQELLAVINSHRGT
ncbi:hypothetical protein PG987_006284 [Apiospora arundinis]